MSKERKPPVNALSPKEREMVTTMIRNGAYADYSVRELSLSLLEKTGTYVSPVSFWTYQVRMECQGRRRQGGSGGAKGGKPDTTWVTGPNQLWSWDITHLPTGRPYEFSYLYALEDWFSRKTVAWVVTDRLDSLVVQDLWDLGLLNEGLLLLPATRWPKSLSDRGTQMRSISTRRYFHKIGVAQMFARPRTPNDNAQIEALFSTVKTEPEYPGLFPTIEGAHSYFAAFFRWYNEGHLHTRLSMLTPCQVHSGQAPAILAQRQAARQDSLARRRRYHREGIQIDTTGTSLPTHRPFPIRFQYPLPVDRFQENHLPLDDAQIMRHLLIN